MLLLWLAGLIGSSLCGFVAPANARSLEAKLDQARDYYDQARQAHASLVLTPPDQRTEKDYAQLIEDFRRVYLTAPTYGNDTVCLMMIGELSEEAARRFTEPRYFEKAIESYQFLLKAYPQSQFRFEALMSVARIYREDLAQPVKALDQYKRYLKTYPGSAQAHQAEAEIASLQDELSPRSSKPSEKPAETASVIQPSAPAPARVPEKSGAPEPPVAGAESAKSEQKTETVAAAPASSSKPEAAASPAAATSPVATISDVRFWKASGYSRVVLETGQKVRYEVGRVSSPDRLYLDLYDTEVTPASGKTFPVEDGLLKSVRLAQFKAGVSRVVLDLAAKTEFAVSELTNPYRLVIDVHAAGPQSGTAAVGQDLGKQAGSGAAAANSAANSTPAPVLAAKQSSPASSKAPDARAAVVAKASEKASEKGSEKTPATAQSLAKPAASKPEPTQLAKASPAPLSEKATPDESVAEKPFDKVRTAEPIRGGGETLTRALGLKIGRIVIDPGHGGHDTGTIGPTGYTEKDLVLDVSQRLGKLIEERLGSEVSYTRDDDSFIPLEKRAEIANESQADLFISIHANSSRSKSATGIETYYLSLTTDPEALEVAARENAVSQETISDLQDLVQKITLNEKVDESREFATKVQAALSKSLARGRTSRFDRGVKKAPFVVLIGANMPAILTEISFLSNPETEKRLKTPEQRQKIAEALYAGVASYAGTLSGVKTVRDDKKPGTTEPSPADKPQPTQTAALD